MAPPRGALTYNAGFMFVGDFNGDGRADFMYNRDGWLVEGRRQSQVLDSFASYRNI
jgi:hypothetical protein